MTNKLDTVNRLIDIAFSKSMLDCLEYDSKQLTPDRRAPSTAGRYLLAGLRKGILDVIPEMDIYDTLHANYYVPVRETALYILTHIADIINRDTTQFDTVTVDVEDMAAIASLRGGLLSNIVPNRRVYTIGNMTIHLVGSRACKLVSKDTYTPTDAACGMYSLLVDQSPYGFMQVGPDAAALYYRINICILRLLLSNKG